MSKINALNGWSESNNFFGRRSAQSYFNSSNSFAVSGSCGSACGAGDGDKDPEPKPTACGSACGAGDQ